MSKETGGPAFPVSVVEGAGYKRADELESAVRGMTLRDYFAAHAIQGLLAGKALKQLQDAADAADENYDEFIAAIAYVWADAMLAERAK